MSGRSSGSAPRCCTRARSLSVQRRRTIDPSSVECGRTRHFCNVTPDQQPASLGIGKIQIAESGDRRCLTTSSLFGRGIGALNDLTQKLKRLVACSLWGPGRALPPDDMPPLPTLYNAVSDKIGHGGAFCRRAANPVSAVSHSPTGPRFVRRFLHAGGWVLRERVALDDRAKDIPNVLAGHISDAFASNYRFRILAQDAIVMEPGALPDFGIVFDVAFHQIRDRLRRSLADDALRCRIFPVSDGFDDVAGGRAPTSRLSLCRGAAGPARAGSPLRIAAAVPGSSPAARPRRLAARCARSRACRAR